MEPNSKKQLSFSERIQQLFGAATTDDQKNFVNELDQIVKERGDFLSESRFLAGKNKKQTRIVWVLVVLLALATASIAFLSISSSHSAKKVEMEAAIADSIAQANENQWNGSLQQLQKRYQEAHESDSARGVAIEDMDIIQENYDQLQLPPMWIGACNSRELQRIHRSTDGAISWEDLRYNVSGYFGGRYAQIKTVLNAAPGLLIGVMNNPKNKPVLEWLKKNVFNGYDMSEDMIPYLQGTSKKYEAIFTAFFLDHSKKPAKESIWECEGWKPCVEKIQKAFPNDFLDDDGKFNEWLLQAEYKKWRSAHVLPPPARMVAVQLIKSYNALGK